MRTNSSNRETIHPPLAMRGFTLIEIMIVVVIIGILAAIAFPQYQNYLMKSRRTDARSLLSQIASREEQFFADNRAYTTTLSQLNYPVDANGNVVTENGYYTIAAQQTSNYDFVLTATPVGIQAKDECTTITLDNTGKKGFTASSGTTPSCW